MPHLPENISSVHGSGNPALQVHSPCHSVSSAIPVTNGLLSTGLTNSSCSEHPLSESSGGVLAQPQISGNVMDFQSFLDEPSNWEWAVNALSVEPGHSDRNIFVSKLPPAFKDKDLHAMFQSFGHVVSAKVMLNVKTGISKETGFVQFGNYKDALRARAFFRLRAASFPTTPAMPEVVTQWAQNKHDGGLYGDRCHEVRKLFIRNVPASVTQAEMKAFVSRFGNVSDISVHSDTYDPSPTSSAVRGRRLKLTCPDRSEGKETEMVPSSPETNGHETIICFVTFAEAGAATRACREIHNTTPFDSCNGVPLMAKLAEDNSSRHARRHHSAAAANAAASSWGTRAPFCDASSAYSSEAPTPLAGSGGYHRGSHQPQMPASQHLQQQQCNATPNYAMQQLPPPMLSANYLSAELSPVRSSQPSTPQYPSQGEQRPRFDIPAPRRAFQQLSVAVSPTATMPPATVITPSSPSLLSTTMSPSAEQRPRTTATPTSPAERPMSTRARRVPLPPALSVEATTTLAAPVTALTTEMPTPTSLHSTCGALARSPPRRFGEAPVQVPHHCQSAELASPADNYSSSSYTSMRTPYIQQESRQLYEQQYQQRPLLMHHGAVHGAFEQNGELYHEYSYSSASSMEPKMHLASSLAPPEAVHEYGDTAGSVVHDAYQASDHQYIVAPLWQRRMERQGTIATYSADVAAPAGVLQLSPCAAYGAPQGYPVAKGASSMDAGMQMRGWETSLRQQANSAAASPYTQYPPTMVVNSGSQATTPSSGASGSVRYRNNPYSMRLVQTVAQDSTLFVGN
ncbi:hypothetical protein GH5_03720 [Leishmania sp. Ghana 2012 LV757]|uniref:hypothetical protein n=1 Tax=Leishmania sp. Ghana 2012 LV757 TaxID=2803181 RepID=UPI001B77D79C|nr:hypothetical protein GH5_03720 [Leishmania sp. Ghana 2012 LV757]